MSYILIPTSCSEVKTNEKDRYGVYVTLCNMALERLKQLNSEKLGIRNASSLDLCFQRSDPKPLQSRYDGTGDNVKRNPDVVATSRVAALDVADREKFDQPPKIALQWCQPFMTIEFKLLQKNFMSKFNDTAKADFTSISRADKIEQLILENSDPTSVIDQESHRKRKYRTDHTEGPSLKTRRSTSHMVSKPGKGSVVKKSDVKSPSIHSAGEFMGTSESLKAVSHRVQLATYALELLSYSLGVHHTINLLLIGKSFPTLWISMF